MDRLDCFSEQCPKCSHSRCPILLCGETCPMYFESAHNVFPRAHCRCVEDATSEEQATGRCKFFEEVYK